MRKMLTIAFMVFYATMLVSQPGVTHSPDSLTISISGCNDSSQSLLVLGNTGSDTLFYNLDAEARLVEDFDDGLDPDFWHSVTNLIASGSCGSVSATNALYFTGSGTREAVTKPFDVAENLIVSFYLKFATGSSPCENADANEDMVLEYSNDLGASFQIFRTYDTEAYPNFTLITEDLSAVITARKVMLRWRQVAHSGGSSDNLAIDNITLTSSARSIAGFAFSSGHIIPGQQVIIPVTFYAASLATGVYRFNLVVTTNDSANPSVFIPVELTVSGDAWLDISKSHFDFDTMMATLVRSDSVLVYNKGCDSLHITGFLSSEPGFSHPALPFSVPPYESAWFILTYLAGSTGHVNAVITLQNNDADTLITASVFVFPKPLVATQPFSSYFPMQGCNDSLQVTLTIENTYPDSLTVDLWSQELSSITHLQILAFNLGTSTTREYPNTIAAINQLYTNYTLTQTNTSSVEAFRKALVNKDILLITEPSSASASVFTTLAPAMQEFAGRGGRIVFCGTSNSACVFNTGLFSGNYVGSTSASLTVVDAGHSFTTGLPTSYNGPGNNFVYNFTDSDFVRLVNAATGIISGYRRFGSGLVAYIGFDFYNINANAARLLTNLITAPYATYGNISAGKLVVPASSTGSVQLNFEGNGLISDLYPGRIFIASPQIGWFDTLDYVFDLIGNPYMELSLDTLVCIPTIVGASSINQIMVYNEGCDTLVISVLSSSDSVFQPQGTPVIVLPFDSTMLSVSFNPTFVGIHQANLQIENNHLNRILPLQGVGLHVPHLGFSADTLSAVFHQCHDTINDTVYIINTGLGELEFEIVPFSGSILDSTSVRYFSTTGELVSHTFTGLPTEADTLKLVFTINGDYDATSEYMDLYVEGLAIGTMPGGPTNTNISATYTFTGVQVQNWLMDGVLQVDMQNSSSVNTGYGTNLNQARLILSDLPLFEISPMTGNVPPLDTLMLNLLYKSRDFFNGNYLRKVVTNSNDPSNPVDQLWFNITIDNPALLAVDAAQLDFGAISRNLSVTRSLEVYNHGSEMLMVYFQCLDTSFKPALDSLLLLPCSSEAVDIVFTPDSIGLYTDTLQLSSAGGNIMIPMQGMGLGRPEIKVDPLLFNIKLIDTTNVIDTLMIANIGEDTLHCLLSDQNTKEIILLELNKANLTTCSNLKGDNADDYIRYLENAAAVKADAPWLSTSVSSLSVAPGDAVAILVYFTGKQMAVGFNAASLLLNSNDPVTPLLTLPVQSERAFKNFTTYDNNNNALQDIPDNDMDIYLCRSSAIVPIEFNIFVEDTAFTSGQLSLYNYDIDETSGEVDKVYLNGHFIGTLTGANNQWSTTVLNFPGAYLNPGPAGKNVIQIHVDVTNAGWCTTIDWGQIVTDNTPSGTAFIRYALPDRNIYLPGQNVLVTNEIDADSGAMSVRVETNLLDSNQVNIDGISRNLTINGSNDEPFTENLTFPAGSYLGKYFVQVIVYDAITFVQQDIRYIEIEKGLPPIGLGLQGGEVCPGDTVVVSVTAQNLEQVAAFMLNLQYVDSLASYIGYQNLNPALAAGNVSVNTANNHLLFQFQANTSVSLVNGLLVELKFIVAKSRSSISVSFSPPNPTRFVHASGYIFHIADSTISDSLLTFPPAIITQQPVDLTVLVDGLAVFTATAERASAYIWERSVDNGLSYQSITDTSVVMLGSILIIAKCELGMDGHRFRVAVIDTCGDTIRSQSAILHVIVSNGLNIKVFLQGAWQAGKGSMRTQLKNLPTFPLTQPYNVAPWFYTGNETVDSTTQGMVDWVLVELRSSPDTIIERKAGILLADGNIVAPDLSSGVQFVNTGNYYLTVRHRNHLSVMTADPIQIPYAGIHDFTDASAFQPYGGAGVGTILLEPGTYGMIMGDILQDANLKYSGASNDRAPILTRILSVVGGTAITSTITGYYREDLNMDGVVKYSGQNNDQARIIQNIVNLKGTTAITAIFIGPVPVGIVKH